MPEIQQLNQTTFGAILPCGETLEIGDRESLDFKPHFKLNRFRGERYLKVGLPVTERSLPIIKGDTITWEGRNKHILMYPLPPTTQFELGSYEYEVVLDKKPKTNKIALNIQSQGLKFFYQPVLTPQEIEEGCVRPKDIIGSYAIYHDSKGGLVTPQDVAKGITTGKAFHIPRPKIFDARGNWVWGELYYDEKNGLLITTIPQEFLEYAHYPIRHAAGDTFGYTSIGGTESQYGQDRIHGHYSHTGAVGTGVSMSIWVQHASSFKLKMAVYVEGTPEALVAGSGTAEHSGNKNPVGWITLNSDSPTFSAVNYMLCAWSDLQNVNYYYDAGKLLAYLSGQTYGNPWPDPISSWTDKGTYVRNASIYCTYEEEAPAVAPTVTTQDVSDIEAETATGNGTITNIGSENCSKRGVCWNTTGNPTVVGILKYITALVNSGKTGSHDVAVSGNFAYVCGYWDDALYVINISNPENPSLTATLTEGRLDGIHDIVIDGNYAYVTCINRNSVVSIDISSPAEPLIVGEVIDATKLADAHALVKDGNYIYIGSFGNQYFTIINAANPASMSIVGDISDAKLDGCRGVCVHGSYVYAVCRDSGYLCVMDVSDKENPSIHGSVQLSTAVGPRLQNIKCKGNYAYVTSYTDDKLVVVDISNPATPSKETDIAVVGANYVILHGDYALVSSAVGVDEDKVVKISIANPSSPVLIDFLTHTDLDFACGMAMVGEYLLCSPRDTSNKILVVLSALANDKSEETDSFGTGAFTRPMTGLTPGQHYYVKAYAYNSAGYGYGNQVEFDTLEPTVYYHGLKVQGVGELALCNVENHPLRIRKDGITYGIELVATDDPNASRIRVRTGVGIKAVRKYT